ncbi:septin [Talaromyces stipitatus ATCC 10500]|uniref:Septin n=1 Tax=Talaromyces stipitatus (strain ATCC 10500 / CBS 375.48 / QM 6759 / NRRL 1006) TaxID=441959 RepID=B8MMK7_TALSN|nr:septin [Talaromyces stipitatus ATCC 10500]EED13761.1 septin [Talaromyces stipitatus ATCC 10500]
MASVQSRTPGGSQPPHPSSHPPPPPPDALPSSVNDSTTRLSVNNLDAATRRSSLGFLRRPKSTEPLSERKSSNGKVSKKMKEQMREEELRRQRESIPKQAPRLPDLAPAPKMQTFGGEEQLANRIAPVVESRASSAHVSMPPPAIDPYARTESMTHRGRYSYASSAVSTINSPRRLRRRKDPTPYNLLVVGAKNSGKTSFLNFLRKSLALPPNKHPIRSSEDILEEINSSSNPNFTSHYLETEIEGERVGLTLWDSEGLERNVVDLQLRDITAFLESKFEDTLMEEMKVVRSPGARDTHIHCVFWILDPVRLDSNLAAAQKAAGQTNGKYTTQSRGVGILDEDLDLQFLRVMQGKTAVVPVISKADTITTAHMAYLKKAVSDSLKQARIDPLEVLILEEAEDEDSEAAADDDEDLDDTSLAEHGTTEDKAEDGDTEKAPKSSPTRSHKSNHSISLASNSDTPFIPLSILSPDPHSLNNPDLPTGRHFPWGFADPYNPEHCDFVKLKESVFRDWRAELREASRELCYERWRTSRLNIKQEAPRKSSNTGRFGPPPTKSGRATR